MLIKKFQLTRKNCSLKTIVLTAILICASSLCFAAGIDTAKEELFFVAQKAFEDGFYDVALRYLEQFQEKYPNTDKSDQAKLLIGQCYFFQNQYLKAYNVFHGLSAASKLRDAISFWLGETYLKGGDFNQAVQYYQIVIKEYPESEYAPQAYYSLGWTYFEQGEYQKAKYYFETFLSLFPAHAMGEDVTFKLGECEQNLGHYSAAVAHFSHYLQKYPQSPHHAETYFYIAEAHYYAQDYLAAVTYYAKAADLAVDTKIIYLAKVSMGWCYLKLEKLDLAEQYFQEAEAFARQKNILSDDVYIGLAHLYEEKGQYDNSLRYYDALITEFPSSPKIAEAHLGKANLYYQEARYPQAVESFSWIIDNYKPSVLDETLEKAYYGLAWTYLKSGDPERSIKTFETIIKISPNHLVKVSALTQIGNAYMEINKLEQAIEIYDRILREFPESIYADLVQFQQAIALLRLDQIDAASLSFQSLRTNFPTSKYVAQSNYYLCLAYFKKEDWAQAIGFAHKYLESGHAKKSLLTETYYLLALSHFNLKQYKEAMQYFQNVAAGTSDGTPNLTRAAEFYYAKCLHQIGQDKEAIKNITALIQKYPRTDIALDAFIWLGDYFLEEGEFTTAIDYYTQAIDMFPLSEKCGLLRYEIGQAFTALGQLDQAIKYYQLIDPKAGEEIYGKAKIAIADLFSQDLPLEKALETYQKLAETTPDFARDAYVKIGLICKKNGRYLKAIESFTAAQSASPRFSEFSDAELLFMTADTEEIINQKDRAMETYLKIPYLFKNETNWVIKAYLRVGRIFEEKEQWEEAATIYSKVVAFPTEEAKYAQERLNWIQDNVR